MLVFAKEPIIGSGKEAFLVKSTTVYRNLIYLNHLEWPLDVYKVVAFRRYLGN